MGVGAASEVCRLEEIGDAAPLQPEEEVAAVDASDDGFARLGRGEASSSELTQAELVFAYRYPRATLRVKIQFTSKMGFSLSKENMRVQESV